MTMPSYDGVNFWVFTQDDKYVPGLTLDSQDGHRHYSATIWIPSFDDFKAMFGKRSLITPKRPEGTLDTVIHVEAGPGELTLKVPGHTGHMNTYSNAVLISIQGKGTINAGQIFYTADAEWIVSSNPVP
jgi:hypothetical protein